MHLAAAGFQPFSARRIWVFLYILAERPRMNPHDPGGGAGEAIQELWARVEGVPLSRRDAVRLLAAAGLLSLGTGCVPAAPAQAAAVAGPALSLNGAGQRFPLVIDVHTHIFNARDVPAAEYFLHSMLHLDERTRNGALVPRTAAFLEELIAHLTTHLREMVPCARDEREMLLGLERQGLNPFSPGQLGRPIGDEQEMCAWRLRIREILQKMPRREAEHLTASRRGSPGEVPQHAESAAACREPTLLDLRADPGQCVKATLATYGNFSEPIARLFVQVESLLFGDEARASTLARWLREPEIGPTLNMWLRRMARPRYEIARELIRTYGALEPNADGVDAFVVAMVDMQQWLGSQTDPLRDQVELTREIARLSNGRLLPFVAYDPLRDVREGGDALRLVQSAVNEQGFVGVKLYPANGFRPIANAELRDFAGGGAVGDSPRTLGRALDDRLIALYRWCASNGVPIMAHGNETMGTLRRYSDRGNPGYWRWVAAAYPELRINIGHFGGMSSLSSWRRVALHRPGTSDRSPMDVPENGRSRSRA